MGCISITTSYVQIVQELPMSMSAGSTSVISNLIGEKDSRFGKVVAAVTFLEGVAFAIALSILTFTYSNELAKLYTKNPEITEKLDGVFQAASL